MSITLTITDNGDGTGTAAITGSDPASNNVVSIYEFDGDTGALTLSQTVISPGAAYEGDWTNSFTEPAGHYIFCLLNDLAGTTTLNPPVYASITDGTQSVYYQICAAVQTRIRTLGLSTISNANIVVRTVPIARDLTLPGIVIAPQREVMPVEAGTNQQDDVTYGVVVAIVAEDNQNHANLAKYTLWREQIAKAFRGRRLAGVDEVWNCVVQPAEAVSLREWYANKFVGAMLLQFTARELRA